MNTIRTKFGLALVALVLAFAGCKGESPTAPPPSTGGGTPGGGVIPPTGSAITLTVSNATPLVNSTTVVTATVTNNGQPVVNGTAVEFTASPLGTFTDTGTATTIRTTTNGVTTATLTSASPGTTTITAVVTNVTKSTTVEFKSTPIVPPPPDTAPQITSISPLLGRPQGGEILHIIGKNFRAPVRVLFNTGEALPKEGQVVSVTATQIDVLTPSINLGAGQQKAVPITVIVDAGSPNEISVNSPTPFTFQVDQLTPIVTTVSPAAGPVNGGTRITIFGEGFQAPVQVFFGAQEAQVVNVTFSQIIVMSPPAPSTTPGGSGTFTGFVPVRVININSNKDVTLGNAFRYTPTMVINAIRPVVGPAIGGTDITIDGAGFDDPVIVTVAGIPAQVLRVSGTQILARTLTTGAPCATTAGPVAVTNIEDGATAASAASFSFQPVLPRIVSITPQNIFPGQSTQVTVHNPGVGPLGTAEISFKLDDRTVFVSPVTITSGTGDQVFTVTVPNNIVLPTVACTTGVPPVAGTQFGPLDVDVTFTNVTTGCSTLVQDGLRVIPNPASNPCVIPPPPQAAQAAPTPPSCANAGSAVAAGTATGTATITFRNDAAAGSQSLRVTSTGVTGPNAGDFAVAPATVTIAPGQTGSFTVTFDPSAVGVRNGTANFTTNDPGNASFAVCLQGTGT